MSGLIVWAGVGSQSQTRVILLQHPVHSWDSVHSPRHVQHFCCTDGFNGKVVAHENRHLKKEVANNQKLSVERIAKNCFVLFYYRYYENYHNYYYHFMSTVITTILIYAIIFIVLSLLIFKLTAPCAVGARFANIRCAHAVLLFLYRSILQHTIVYRNILYYIIL